jgi:YD repeat-containing protein
MINRGRVHVLRILDQSGDTQLTYDPQEETGTKDVEARFLALMERGFVAFDVTTEPGRIITSFDPNASEIIVTPRFAGG